LQTCLTENNILEATICISLDLSKPGGCIDSLLFWLNVVREQIQIIAEKLSKTN